MQTPQQIAACPNCGSRDAKKISYTWWGGALGPRLANLVKCNSCGTEYNSKTGKSNRQFVIIYMIVSALVVFCACGGLAFFGSMVNQH